MQVYERLEPHRKSDPTAFPLGMDGGGGQVIAKKKTKNNISSRAVTEQNMKKDSMTTPLSLIPTFTFADWFCSIPGAIFCTV